MKPDSTGMPRWLRYGVLLVCLGATGLYVWTHRDGFSAVREFRPLPALALVALQGLYLCLYGLIFRTMILRLGVRMTFHEYFGLTVLKSFTNYFLPAHLGLTANSLYLKKKAGLSYTHFGAYFVAQSVLVTASSAFYGLLGTFWVTRYLPADMAGMPRVLYGLFAAMLAGILLLFYGLPRLHLSGGRVRELAGRFLQGWDLMRRDRLLVVRVFLFGFAGYCISALSIVAGFAAFGLAVPFRAAFLAGVLGSLINYVNLTPANLGIQEPFFALMARVLGLGFNQGLLVSGLNRAAQMLLVFTLAPVYSWLLMRGVPPASGPEAAPDQSSRL